jgi:DNA-binding MarR family transcriptional regulator
MFEDEVQGAFSYEAEPDHLARGLHIARWWLKARRLREDMFGPGLFSDPAWDILLDLYTAEAKGERVQITSLAIAARVPHSTAIRWAGMMTRAGLLVRQRDPRDARRIHISLSASAKELMREYLEKLSRDGQAPIPILAHQLP